MQTNVGEEGYLQLLEDVLTNGRRVNDRTGVGTRSVFGRQLRFDLTKYFPLLTTKRVHHPAMSHELLWFLAGDTNIAYLLANNVHIWDEWADENGDLGPIYSKQWRSWPGKLEAVSMYDSADAFSDLSDKAPYVGIDVYHDEPGYRVDTAMIIRHKTIDQISNVMASLRDNPHGRRHIVSAWNPAEVDDMALPPCHCLFQFHVRELTVAERETIAATGECLTFGGAIFQAGTPASITDPILHAELDRRWRGSEKVPRYALDCQLYQRSADLFLGVPFNIASYALLTHMIAQQLGYVAGEFVHTFGDAHIYNNHVDQVREQLSREILAHPTLTLTKAASIFDYKFEDISFKDYKPHKTISAPVAK